MAEENAPQRGDIGQRPERHSPGQGGLDADIALSDQAGQAKAEQGQRKACSDLVGKQCLRQECENQAQRRAARRAADKAKQGASGFDRRSKADDRAHDHHPLDPEVEDARFFDNQFADGSKQDRHRCHHQGRDQNGGVDCGKVHYLVPVGLPDSKKLRMR